MRMRCVQMWAQGAGSPVRSLLSNEGSVGHMGALARAMTDEPHTPNPAVAAGVCVCVRVCVCVCVCVPLYVCFVHLYLCGVHVCPCTGTLTSCATAALSPAPRAELREALLLPSEPPEPATPTSTALAQRAVALLVTTLWEVAELGDTEESGGSEATTDAATATLAGPARAALVRSAMSGRCVRSLPWSMYPLAARVGVCVHCQGRCVSCDMRSVCVWAAGHEPRRALAWVRIGARPCPSSCGTYTHAQALCPALATRLAAYGWDGTQFAAAEYVWCSGCL